MGRLSQIRGRARRTLRLLDEPERPTAPFVVGVPRSGTTLLRLMLDAHPDLAIPPETPFLPNVIGACREAEKEGRDPGRTAIRLVTTHRRWPDFGLTEADLRASMKAERGLTATDAARAFYEAYAAKQGKERWGEKTPQYVKTMKRIGSALPEAHFIHLIRDGRDVALSRLARSGGRNTTEDAAVKGTTRVRRPRRKSRSAAHSLEGRREGLVTDPGP